MMVRVKIIFKQHLHLDRISREFLAPQQRRQIDIKLQTSGEFLRQDTGDVRLFVGFC